VFSINVNQLYSGVSNGISILAAGFNMERDLGNNANYANTALRVALEQGLLPGPTIIPGVFFHSGL
jgi:imidazolonepropionase-like amidohydrolase